MLTGEDINAYTGLVSGWAEPVTLAAVAKVGIFDHFTETLVDEVITTAPAFTASAAELTGAAAGQALVRGSVNYTVRQVVHLPPDGALVRLVLAKA